MTVYADPLQLLGSTIVFRTLALKASSLWRNGNPPDIAYLVEVVRLEILNVHSDHTMTSNQELRMMEYMCNLLDDFEKDVRASELP